MNPKNPEQNLEIIVLEKVYGIYNNIITFQINGK